MNARTLGLVGAVAGTAAGAGRVSAEFVSISVEEFVGVGWLENGYGMTGLTTYRMYANFSGEEEDGVLAPFGITGFPMSLHSTGGYHNDPLGGMTAPFDLTGVGIWENQWDTYVTINATSAQGDLTIIAPNFDTMTNNLGSDWTTENGGWFVDINAEQSKADEDNRVLLMQLVAPAGSDAIFSGTINLLLRDGTRVEFLAFSSVPAPAVPALLVLAGLINPRRRLR